MKINNKAISTICPEGVVQQWKVTPGPCSIKNGGAILGNIIKTSDYYQHALQIDIKLRANLDRDQIEQNISTILSEFIDPVEIELDGDSTYSIRSKYYKGVLQKYQITHLVNKARSQKLSLTLIGYFHSQKKRISFHITEAAPSFDVVLNSPAIADISINSIFPIDDTTLDPEYGVPVVKLTGLTEDTYTGKDQPIVIPIVRYMEAYRFDIEGSTGKILRQYTGGYTDEDGMDWGETVPGGSSEGPVPLSYGACQIYDFPVLNQITNRICTISGENIHSAWGTVSYTEIY